MDQPGFLRRVAVAALVATVALGVSACGGGGKSSSTPTNGATPEQADFTDNRSGLIEPEPALDPANRAGRSASVNYNDPPPPIAAAVKAAADSAKCTVASFASEKDPQTHITGESAATLSIPPLSGAHNGFWADWGVYNKPIPYKHQLHNLEHGGVIIHYGTEVPVEITLKPIETSGGGLMLSAIADSAGRGLAQEKAEWLATFPERNPNPIFEFDLVRGTVHYVNPSAARIFPDLQSEGIRHPLLAGLPEAVGGLLSGEIGTVRREVLAGEKAKTQVDNWLPEETLAVIRENLVAIKGPLTTPVGGGIRSLNVALRQQLDLYACIRPVRWFEGVPSPVKHPEQVEMVIFRENTEDIYAGIEFQAGTAEVKKLRDFLIKEMGVKNIRFPETSSLGIKPVSEEGTTRLVRAAIEYALANGRKSVTLVHKGNIMKYTEGGFRDWGYQLAKRDYGAVEIDGGPWCKLPNGLIIKDVIADAFLQQILTRPAEYDVIATLNLNGDYISDALAAQVGGIGIAPGANINYVTGHAIFEATHGTAPKYANQDKVNPGSVILSGEMMFRYLGWVEVADLIIRSLDKTIAQKRVTYDFHRLMEGATLLKCSEFANAMVENM